MARGDPKNLWQAFCKKIFGTLRPSPIQIKYFLVVIVIIFFITSVAGFFIHSFIQTTFFDKADVHVSFGFYNKDSIGYYMPIQIVNSGDKDLSDISFKAKTCYMDDFDSQHYDALYTAEEYQLRNKDTFEQIQKKWCYPDIEFPYSNCEIDIYVLNSTNLYVPEQICSVYLCDLCKLEAYVNSSELKETKYFNSTIFSPRRIDLQIKSGKYLNVNISNLEKFPEVGFNFFSAREICIWEGNCSISNISDNSILYYLPQFPINMTLNPKEYNEINMSIDYADFGKILSEEIRRGRVNISVTCRSENPEDCPKEIPLSGIKIKDIVFE